MQNDCIFCEFSKNTEIKIYENDLFYSFFDSFPVTPGHALVIPKRHVVNFADLNKEEWDLLNLSVKDVIKIIENIDLKKKYQNMRKVASSGISIWFINKAIEDLNRFNKPDAYNHGLNDGTSAGRTVNHLHWHIIPRYKGDMEDPRGGVRYVIPGMGNYKIERK